MSKFNYKNLLNKEYKVQTTPDIDKIDNKRFVEKFVKDLREKLNMSQASFAKALGISTNTVEKWEMGLNNPSAATKRLLYLLEENTYLMNQLYSIKTDVYEYKKSPDGFFKTTDVKRNIPYKSTTTKRVELQSKKHWNVSQSSIHLGA